MQRKGKKGKRLVAREIDFNEDDSEVISPSEDQLTATSYASKAIYRAVSLRIQLPLYALTACPWQAVGLWRGSFICWIQGCYLFESNNFIVHTGEFLMRFFRSFIAVIYKQGFKLPV